MYFGTKNYLKSNRNHTVKQSRTVSQHIVKKKKSDHASSIIIM
jgi:hypothetical protein